MADKSPLVEIVNKTEFSFDEEKIVSILNKILNTENANFFSKNIVVVFVDNLEIKELNKRYRKKDYATDVLSFFYNEKDVLGEVIVCPEQVFTPLFKNNEKKKTEQQHALYRVVIHGVLHLLGYTHDDDDSETVMNSKTEKYLKEIK